MPHQTNDQEDLTGQVFGRLIVLRLFDQTRPISAHNNRWVCRCSCRHQNEIVAYKSRLVSGTRNCCGCKRSSWRLSLPDFHGPRETHPLYGHWTAMIGRCCNPNHGGYSSYGGRGISVCDRWKNDFGLFVLDMSEGWAEGLSLDRIDNEHGNYEPGAVRWSTSMEQGNNRRDNVAYTVKGETLNLSEMCRKYGQLENTIRSRLSFGWSVEDAFLTPPKPQAEKLPVGDLTHGGKTQSVSAWSRETGIASNVMYLRLKKGWPHSRIVTEPVRKMRQFIRSAPRS